MSHALKYTLLCLLFSMSANGMYFVTVSDTEHFPWLNMLIESILKYNYTQVKQIAVFDLGLTQEEVQELNQLPFVTVHNIKDTNEFMRKKFVVRTSGRLARGWYSWKPAVMHQALELFPYFLYLDSGIEVVAPLNDIFDEIKENGYYLYDATHLIWPVVTKKVIEEFNLQNIENRWILEAPAITAGIQGISRSLLESYILPIYRLSSDISYFEDDGSALWGYGFGRHDQSLFSIFVRRLKLKTHPLYCSPKKIRDGSRKIYFGALKHFKLRKHIEKDPTRLEHAKKHMLLG